MDLLNSKKILLLLDNPANYHERYILGNKDPEETKLSDFLYDSLLFPELTKDKYIVEVKEPEDKVISRFIKEKAAFITTTIALKEEIQQAELEDLEIKLIKKLNHKSSVIEFLAEVEANNKYLDFLVAKENKILITNELIQQTNKLIETLMWPLDEFLYVSSFVQSSNKIILENLRDFRPPFRKDGLPYEHGIAFNDNLTIFHRVVLESSLEVNLRIQGTRSNCNLLERLHTVFLNADTNVATFKFIRTCKSIYEFPKDFYTSEDALTSAFILLLALRAGTTANIEFLVIDEELRHYTFKLSDKTKEEFIKMTPSLLEKAFFHVYKRAFKMPFDYHHKLVQL